LIFAAPILLWSYGAYREAGVEPLLEVWRQSVMRFSSSAADHARPVYSYFGSILFMALPWTVLMPAVLWRHFAPSRWKAPLAMASDGLFPRVWLGAMLIALSLASAKRKLYLAPILPSIALLVALWWDGVAKCGNAPAIDRFLLRWLPTSGAVFLVAGLVAMFTAEALGPAVGAAVILAGAVWLVRPYYREVARPGPAMAFFVVCEILGAGAFNHAWVLPRARADSLDSYFETIARDWRDRGIVLYNPSETSRGAMVYYLGRYVPVARETEDAVRWAHEDPQVLLIAEGKNIEKLVSALCDLSVKPLLSAQAGDRRVALMSVSASVAERP
jgi:hypothetical protein